MNFDAPQSARFMTLFSQSAERQATTDAKLNCLSEAYQEIAAKGLAAIESIADDERRGRLAQDFAAALDRHLSVMEEFTCVGASETMETLGIHISQDPTVS